MYEVKAYHCSYCKRYKLTKAIIIEHERSCFRNPATRSCATCLFYDLETKQDGILTFENLVCHKGEKFYDKEPQSAFEHIKPKLRSECRMWVEKPVDEQAKIEMLEEHGFEPKKNYFTLPDSPECEETEDSPF